MAGIQFASQIVQPDSFVREHESDAYHPRKKSKAEMKRTSMEEEIRLLRSQMEFVVQSEKSFTSETVIQLSTLLDEKINDYNAFRRQYRNK